MYGIIILVVLVIGTFVIIGYVRETEVAPQISCEFPDQLEGLTKILDLQNTLEEKKIIISTYAENEDITKSTKSVLLTVEEYNNLQDATEQYDARKNTYHGAYSPSQGGVKSGNCFIKTEGTVASGITTDFYCEGEDIEKSCTISGIRGRCVTVDRDDFEEGAAKSFGWEATFTWLEDSTLKEAQIAVNKKGEHPSKAEKLKQMESFIEHIKNCKI